MSDFKHLTEALGNLDEEEVLRILKDFVASNPSQEEAQKAVEACQELLNQAIEILKPVIGSASEKKIGTIVLGTVHGDLHDIGKNIFRNMAEAAGFQVYDLGIDQPVEAFVEKVKEVHPDIVGLSGVLTLALEAMKETIDGLKEAGLRDEVKVIIGGNPVNQEVCEHVGADAWTTNAAEGVKICQGWVRI